MKQQKNKTKLLSILFLLFISVGTFAQSDTEAKKILAGVSKKYKSYDVVKADFSFNLKNPRANVNETQNGTLYVKSNANKYKAIVGNQELISNGQVQWTYLKNDNEVQISEVDKGSEALNPAKIFTIYEKGFKYVYLGDTKSSGRTYQHIELAPLESKSYSKIKLGIDKINQQISNIVVYDKNGNVYTYLIKSFTPNVKVSDAVFSFNTKQHPGVDVVDLR